MSKINWEPGNMLYPLPAVMVTCGDSKENYNIITVAWTGTICTNPPMLYVSIRPNRYSYDIISKTKEFVINLTTKDLVRATDFCGVKSGRDINKFEELNLHMESASKVKSPLIKESPVNIECSLKEIKKLGSHDMFIAEVVAVNVDESLIDENNKLHIDEKLIAYSHGSYFTLDERVGSFGYSVRKK